MTRFDVAKVVSSFRRARVSGLSDEAFAEKCINITLRYFAPPRRARKSSGAAKATVKRKSSLYPVVSSARQ